MSFYQNLAADAESAIAEDVQLMTTDFSHQDKLDSTWAEIEALVAQSDLEDRNEHDRESAGVGLSKIMNGLDAIEKDTEDKDILSVYHLAVANLFDQIEYESESLHALSRDELTVASLKETITENEVIAGLASDGEVSMATAAAAGAAAGVGASAGTATAAGVAAVAGGVPVAATLAMIATAVASVTVSIATFKIIRKVADKSKQMSLLNAASAKTINAVFANTKKENFGILKNAKGISVLSPIAQEGLESSAKIIVDLNSWCLNGIKASVAATKANTDDDGADEWNKYVSQIAKTAKGRVKASKGDNETNIELHALGFVSSLTMMKADDTSDWKGKLVKYNNNEPKKKKVNLDNPGIDTLSKVAKVIYSGKGLDDPSIWTDVANKVEAIYRTKQGFLKRIRAATGLAGVDLRREVAISKGLSEIVKVVVMKFSTYSLGLKSKMTKIIIDSLKQYEHGAAIVAAASKGETRDLSQFGL